MAVKIILWCVRKLPIAFLSLCAVMTQTSPKDVGSNVEEWYTLAQQAFGRLPPSPDWLGTPQADQYILIGSLFGLWCFAGRYIYQLINGHKGLAYSDASENGAPVYWEVVEALSWIAAGKPIKSGTWMSDAREQESKPWPDELSKRFDDAEREFFERVRGGDIEVLAVKEGEHAHAKIPAAHFLGPVAINILHNTLGVDYTNIEDVFEYKGPKYSKLQVKRADVLKLWPEGGVAFTWPEETSDETIGLRRDIGRLAEDLTGYRNLADVRDDLVRRYRRIERSDHEIWNADPARQARRDFLQNCGIALTEHNKYPGREEREKVTQAIRDLADTLDNILNTQ